ncbi:MAG: MFS transporter, partial [Rhodobacteraceae bacterium]|nr:MFS transporter [Paracoccaceae bacterium]
MFKSLSLKVIVFGFIFTFFSSFGQSFFLGLFNSSIRDALSITHGQFGSLYASATLLSSIVLVWIGKKIDDVNILKFASYVIIFLSVSCFIFSKISSVIFLFVGIFLMRLAGQGLTTHTATTTISRFFEKNRGRALSIGWLGLSLAEFILPVLIVFLLTFVEWRNIWISISIVVIIVLPIVAYTLVREIKLDTREEAKNNEIPKEIRQWKRTEVLKDYRFYIIC